MLVGLLRNCSNLLQMLPTIDESVVKEGEQLYDRKPNLRMDGVTWSQSDYRHAGLQRQYVRYKSIQRFTESWACLQMAFAAGALDAVKTKVGNAATWKVASLAGGPGFELTAATHFLTTRFGATSVDTVSLDLESSWQSIAEALGHRFVTWDANDYNSSLRSIAFNGGEPVDVAIVSYALYHYMNTQQHAKWIGASLNNGDIGVLLTVERFENMQHIIRMLRNERVQVVNLMGRGDDRLLALLPQSTKLQVNFVNSESLTFPNVPYTDHKKGNRHSHNNNNASGYKRPQNEDFDDNSYNRRRWR